MSFSLCLRVLLKCFDNLVAKTVNNIRGTGTPISQSIGIEENLLFKGQVYCVTTNRTKLYDRLEEGDTASLNLYNKLMFNTYICLGHNLKTKMLITHSFKLIFLADFCVF